MTGAKVRLIVASALFFGWLGWLGYTALSKSRAPVVSRAQAAATTTPVVAELTDVEGSPNVLVKVIEPLAAGGPTSETLIEVSNLKDEAGYIGPGAYLLLLVKDRTSDSYSVVGQQRSPGYDLAGVGKPVIYPWSADVHAQAKALFP